MIKTLIYTTENNNSYIYDHKSRLSMLIHPDLKKAHENPAEADTYYLKKYEYLKRHGLFSEPKPNTFGSLNESMIKESITKTSQITFEVTDFCNLNCLYCSFGELYEGFYERNIKNIDINYAEKMLKYIFKLKSTSKTKNLIIAFYVGEPLFNGKFIENIINIVNTLNYKKEIKVEYSMTTNATLIHKYVKLLVKYNFELLISLDGNEKNHSYRYYRNNKKNSFHKVIENIDMIQKEYPEYFKNHIRFNAVLHNRNSVKEIYEFIYGRYKKIPRIAELAFDDLKSDKKSDYNKLFHNKLESENVFKNENTDLLDIMHTELSTYKELTNFLKYNSLNFYISNIISLLYGVEKYLPTSTCLPGGKKILMTTNNKLLPCERVNYKYAIGEINKEVILDIPKITQRYKFYFDHIKNVCKHCYSNKFCNTCLFHIKGIDNVDSKEFICEYFCNSKEFTNRLHRIFSFLEKYQNDFYQIIENEVIL